MALDIDIYTEREMEVRGEISKMKYEVRISSPYGWRQ
jgi:hypothetical protein